MTPDSLDELPLFKHHYTSGRRRTMDDYVDLDDKEADALATARAEGRQ